VLLTSWVEHNRQNTDKLRKWVERAKGSKDFPNYNSAIEAAQQVKEATQGLSQALAEL